LANLDKNVVRPLGKCFGIQIKSNTKPLTFNKQRERDCLYNSSIPFFLGVVSRSSLTLTIYNTQGRLCFFWMKGKSRPFDIIPKNTGLGLKAPDYSNGKVWTGKPILKINLKDSSSSVEEIRKLQATMISWINLENQMLSLKEQEVPIVWRPGSYKTNKPLEMNNPNINKPKRIAYSNPATLPNICIATEKILDSLSVYLKDFLNRPPKRLTNKLKELVENQLGDVKKVRKQSANIVSTLTKRHS
jgi:hypothetical protein